jgi:predicted protein tyrosine phosphatase
VAIAHNAKANDLLFLMNSLVRMKLMTEFHLVKEHKIICLKVENVMWLDILNYPVVPLRTLPQAFGLNGREIVLPSSL